MIQRLIKQFSGGSSGSQRRRGGGRRGSTQGGIGAKIGSKVEQMVRGRRR